LGAGKVRGVSDAWPDEIADLIHALRGEPTFAHAFLDAQTIGLILLPLQRRGVLGRSQGHEAALMPINPELDDRGSLLHLPGIEDDEPGIGFAGSTLTPNALYAICVSRDKPRDEGGWTGKY
jgi:hypothetical protein